MTRLCTWGVTTCIAYHGKVGISNTFSTVQPSAVAASTVRFRHHPAKSVAGFIVAISLLTLGVVSFWLMLTALLPVFWMIWLWRSGTDLGPDGIRVRALAGERRVPWSEVRGLVTDRRDRAAAALRGGNSLPLPAMSAADLRRLTAAHAGEQAES